MDINRMTQKVREALASAQTLAVRLTHQEVDGEHILAELLAQDDGLAPRLIEHMDIPLQQMKSRVQEALQKRPKVTGGGIGGPYISQRLSRLFIQAEEEAGRDQQDSDPPPGCLFARPIRQQTLVRRGGWASRP